MIEAIEQSNDQTNGAYINRIMKNQTNEIIYSISQLPNGNLLIVNDSFIKVYNAITTMPIFTLQNRSYLDFIYLQNGTFASCSVYQYMHIWSMTSKNWIASIALNNIAMTLLQLKKGQLVTGADNGVISIYDMPQFKIKGTLNERTNATVQFLIELKDGRLASRNIHQHIKIWDLNTMQNTSSLIEDNTTMKSMIQLSTSDILIGEMEGRIKVYSAYTFKCIKIINDYIGSSNSFIETKEGRVYGYSSDGKTFLLNLNEFYANEFNITESLLKLVV